MDRVTMLKSTEDLQASVPLSPEILVPPELRDGELFHVFLSYSSTDSEWTDSLLEELEARGLRVCSHHRDFTPGRTILENMSECIQQSQKVLLVLSPDFVRSRWCLLEANMSLFRDCLQRKPIIPVLLQTGVCIPLHLSHLTYLEVQQPHFTLQLFRVLCTPNQQLQGYTVVPYQPPSIYNGKTLQPLPAVNEEQLNKFSCGLWSDMEVPDQLRLIIQHPQRYREAIGLINRVSREKVRFGSVWVRVLFTIAAVLLSFILIDFTMIIIESAVHTSPVSVELVFLSIAIILCSIVIIYKLAHVRKNEAKRIVRELQKAVGQANALLFEENVLMGCVTNSKIYLVYVSLDGCRRELSSEFNEALLKYSCRYTCCLAKKHFPFAPPPNPGHLEGGVCLCQYVAHQQTVEMERIHKYFCCLKKFVRSRPAALFKHNSVVTDLSVASHS